jgi:ribonuclease R
MAAERDALDRFTTVFLADRVGAEFAGRISGVTRFGLFVSLAETGADGLIPIASIGDDYYEHDAARHTLAGRSRGRTFRLGDRVIIRLHEANTITGSMVFQLVRDLDETESKPRQQRGRGFSRPPIPRGRRRH